MVAVVGPLAVFILNAVLKVQPFASFTKIVCAPADKPVAKAAVATPSHCMNKLVFPR